MTKPQITEEEGTKIKSFRLPIKLIRKMEEEAKRRDRNLSNYLVHILNNLHR